MIAAVYRDSTPSDADGPSLLKRSFAIVLATKAICDASLFKREACCHSGVGQTIANYLSCRVERPFVANTA